MGKKRKKKSKKDIDIPAMMGAATWESRSDPGTGQVRAPQESRDARDGSQRGIASGTRVVDGGRPCKTSKRKWWSSRYGRCGLVHHHGPGSGTVSHSLLCVSGRGPTPGQLRDTPSWLNATFGNVFAWAFSRTLTN